MNKSYKTRDKKTINAVKDISITVPDGKVLCLLGPSGCGKSTLLSLINGLEKPESGEIWFGEKNVTDVSPEKRGVGMVFQNYALYSHMTVRQNIRMPLDNPVRGDALPKEQKEKRVQEVASMLRIEDTLDRRPDELSGGQQQRVSIARALIRKPEILLLDEPLSNLDKRLRVQILNEIRSIQKITGITTVFVTHDQEEAMGIADLIAVMKEGKIQQVGTPNEIYSNPSNVFTAQFLGNPEINLLKGIIKDGGLFL
ncbi:MAG: ABC transporter ATP-binding protein, partial [Oscillospiraceae bacterium]|nr:ABC transporter ATP-binding protein [Oscillospiraceae bacterium]